MSCPTCPTANKYSLLLLVVGFILFFLAGGNSSILTGAAGLVIAAYLIPIIKPRLTNRREESQLKDKNRQVIPVQAAQSKHDSD